MATIIFFAIVHRIFDPSQQLRRQDLLDDAFVGAQFNISADQFRRRLLDQRDQMNKRVLTFLTLPNQPHTLDKKAVREARQVDQKVEHGFIENTLDKLNFGAEKKFAKAMIIRDIPDALVRVQINICNRYISTTEIARAHKRDPLASTA